MSVSANFVPGRTALDILDAIRNRRSIRAYHSKPVPEEKLQRVLEAARLAPTARNMQEWRLVVVRERDTREKLMKAANNQSFVLQAPVVIAACGVIADYTMRCGQLSYAVDTAIAVDHMTLQAAAEGLGTCWVCAFSEADVKVILGIPSEVRVVALMTLGYPAERPEPRSRKDLSELVAFEKYG